MATRSAQLAAAHVSATGWTTLYTVPAGFVALVKQLHMTSWAATEGQVVIQLNLAVGPAQVRLFNENMANSSLASSELWLVLRSGDQVAAYVTQAPVDILVSGTLLPDS